MTDEEATERSASRQRVAEAYRQTRSAELFESARAAVGGPVEAAARFGPSASGNLMLMSVPLVGWAYAAARSLGGPRELRGVRMLALDGKALYAIGAKRGKGEGEDTVLVQWPRDAVRVAAIGLAGTDSSVTFEVPGEPGRFRLFCSSLRTNPWASDLVAKLGGKPPEPIDPTKLAYGSTEGDHRESDL